MNTCAECDLTCCDSKDFICGRGERCDDEFFYCLFPLGSFLLESTVFESVSEVDTVTRAEQLGCLQPSTALRSDVDTDGEGPGFGPVLGLSNPLQFEVTADRWQVNMIATV